MSSYRIRLLETRLTEDDMDDVALFDVHREDDGQVWRVPVILSPLFRWYRLGPAASEQTRRDMVGGLGARAIVQRLREKGSPPEQVILAIDYPGAPGEPDPLETFDEIAV